MTCKWVAGYSEVAPLYGMFLKYIKLQQLLKTVRKMFWQRLDVTSRHYQVKSEKLIKNEIKKVNKTIREKSVLFPWVQYPKVK